MSVRKIVFEIDGRPFTLTIKTGVEKSIVLKEVGSETPVMASYLDQQSIDAEPLPNFIPLSRSEES